MPATADPKMLAPLCVDLALALRAAAHHGLGEGVCNHFSLALPGRRRPLPASTRAGCTGPRCSADDIVMVDEHGAVLQGRHQVEPTAMFIHAAIHRIAGQACVLHTHMPYATALTLTDRPRAGHRAVAERDALSRPRRGRRRTTTAWRWTRPRANASPAPCRADVAFLANHGVIVCGATHGPRLRRPVLPGARLHGPGAGAVAPAGRWRRWTTSWRPRVAAQTWASALQSELFFEALRRMLPPPRR